MIIQLFLSAAFAASLSGDCYDKNSAKACFELAQKLSKGSASDHQRGELARQKACKLGLSVACGRAVAPEAKSQSTSDTMILKRSETDKHLENLPGLLQDARMEERAKGFEFVQIEPNSIYARLGFKVGDILLEINGHAVESAADATQLFLLLKDEKNFAVKLKRGQKILTRNYQLND